MQRFSNIHILLMSPLLFLLVACKDPSTEKSAQQEIEFTYYKSGKERFITVDPSNSIYVTLPQSFELTSYSRNISLTQDHEFRSQDTYTFFSVDPIKKEDIDYYKNYFPGDSYRDTSNQITLLDYMLSKRSNNLTETSTSIKTTLQTSRGKEIVIASIKGKSTNHSNMIYYQYGIVQSKNMYYLLQYISNADNISYYYEDVIKMFKSFRAG